MRPLARIASGGEISRIMLALETVIATRPAAGAPDHALMPKLVTAQTEAAVKAFAADQERKAAAQKKDEEPEKEGVFTGAMAIHPFTGEFRGHRLNARTPHADASSNWIDALVV